MVFCTGRSGAHLRSLADVLVRALKARRLEATAPGATGAEGAECDDWMVRHGFLGRLRPLPWEWPAACFVSRSLRFPFIFSCKRVRTCHYLPMALLGG